MKKLDEQFDENFDIGSKHNAKNDTIEYYALTNKDGYVDSANNDKIKQFYNEKIKEMVDEMIGERESLPDNPDEPYKDLETIGYNKKRKEIINIAKKYGF